MSYRPASFPAAFDEDEFFRQFELVCHDPLNLSLLYVLRFSTGDYLDQLVLDRAEALPNCRAMLAQVRYHLAVGQGGPERAPTLEELERRLVAILATVEFGKSAGTMTFVPLSKEAPKLPDVRVDVHLPDTMRTEITAMPDRLTSSTIKRDDFGNIETAQQLERDAA